MDTLVPEQFRAEQQAVEAQIRQAFRGVTRHGGVSWSESVVNDDRGDDAERAHAREQDTESCWEDLVDAPSWDHEVGIGGFNFVDPIGFRYYIAPAMIRCLRSGYGEFISYALTVEPEPTGLHVTGHPRWGPHKTFSRWRVSLITPPQADAIARFLRLMIAIHRASEDDIYGEAWEIAYETYWRQRATDVHDTI